MSPARLAVWHEWPYFTNTVEDDVMWVPVSKWVLGIALGSAISATSLAATPVTLGHAIGVCLVAVNGDGRGVRISPTYAASDYMGEYANKNSQEYKLFVENGDAFGDDAKIKIIVQPEHGKVSLESDLPPGFSASKAGWYYYESDKGFDGEDSLVMQVEKYGIKIQIKYTIKVPTPEVRTDDMCNPDEWKISRDDVVVKNGTQLARTTLNPKYPF